MTDTSVVRRAARMQVLLLPAWIALVFFLYPIPHTIALRNLLLLAGVAGIAWTLARADATTVRRLVDPLRGLRSAAWAFALLTLWLIFQSAVLSLHPRQALGLFLGDWVVATMVAAIGIASVMVARLKEEACGATNVLRALALALFAHVLLLLAYQGWRWQAEGVFPFGQTPFAQKDYHSIIVTTLPALLFADLVARRVCGHSGIGITAGSAIAMSALSCLAAVTISVRNAVIIAVVLLVLAVTVLIIEGRRRHRGGIAAIVLALVVFGAALAAFGLHSDERWQGFSEAATVAFETETHKAWMDPDTHAWPKTPSGAPVEASAYLRLAWAKVAVEQVLRYPLGVGYGHKAFGWAVNQSYGVRTGLESSHSGLLDFTLANGIPGILLWLALCAALCVAGWRAFRERSSPVGLMLVFAVVAYLVRCLFDGHLSGFRLEMYALHVGALVAALPAATEKCA